MTTTPEAVEALADAIGKSIEALDWVFKQRGEKVTLAEWIMCQLAADGFTITRSPQMSEEELKLAMEAAIYECEPERNKVKFAIEIAKKYRG